MTIRACLWRTSYGPKNTGQLFVQEFKNHQQIPCRQKRRRLKEARKLKDLNAKNYLFQAIYRPTLETILCNETSKDIWDSMKKKYQGSTRTKRQQLQALCTEFEALRMKTGESVTYYFSRTRAIVNKMRIHGDKTEDVTIVEKSLGSMTPKFNYVVCSIEESKDVDTLSLDELQSSLMLHKHKMNQQEPQEQALKVATENVSLAGRGRGRGRGRSGGRGSNNNREHNQHQQHQAQGRGRGRGSFSTNSKPKPADKSNVECYRCHRYGHYQSEYRNNLNRQDEERTNFAKKEEDNEGSLLMVCHVKGKCKRIYGTWIQAAAIICVETRIHSPSLINL